ncbi:MAG TPA: 23S rRNA (pseudouridine(1915)-N(3))-methyltransferase RlmH [Bacteroidia bacterium]|jgi:23S rRNA (pseudouridine1915-N3)-methyltransferase|nr:23S rRNA (pseudouridine(1915)-N(3))-methyltransferase RlmH [Bacteroidia bacterium]
MKVILIAIGDNEDAYLAKGFEVYEKRLSHYLSFEVQLIPTLKNKTKTKETIMEAEAKEIMKKLAPTDLLILLDAEGKEYSSTEFAGQMQKFLNMPGKRLVFLIGGAYGFAPEVYQRAQQKISLSKMTFNHQMARLFFLEQLYRAMTILKGEKYHH